VSYLTVPAPHAALHLPQLECLARVPHPINHHGEGCKLSRTTVSDDEDNGPVVPTRRTRASPLPQRRTELSDDDDDGHVMPKKRARAPPAHQRSIESESDNDDDSIGHTHKRARPLRATTATSTVVTTATPSTSRSSAENVPAIQEDDDNVDVDIDEEQAVNESCMRLDVDDAHLFSTTLSNREVRKLVGRIAPALATTDPQMAHFTARVKERIKRAAPPLFPTIEANPHDWASTNATMDDLWRQAVAGEQRLFATDMAVPEGLSTEPEHLVKPFGSLTDELLVISSYPTADPASSVHLKFATTNDLSNWSMARLYAKLGYHNIQERKTGMMHIDHFPRRLDRKKMLGRESSVLSNMPKLLALYWSTWAKRCIQMSRATVVVVSGHSATKLYLAYLKERSATHHIIWAHGEQRTRCEMPIAVLESEDTGADVSRLVLFVYHVEGFIRYRAHRPTDMQRNIAIRERLLDFASIIIHGDAPRQNFLSTCAWFFQTSTGLLMPITAFEDFTPENDTLSPYLSRPTLNLRMMDELIAKSSVLKAKKKDIYNVRKKVNVKPLQAVSYWQRPEVSSIYGPYTTTYSLMSARYDNAKTIRRDKERARVAGMDPEQKEANRLRKNQLKTAGVKRRKAAAIAAMDADD
jgi:hypothetical protein